MAGTSSPLYGDLSDKQFGELIQHVFLRPFSRGPGLIYTGIVDIDNTYVMTNRSEEKYKYAEPLLSIGIVTIINVDQAKLIRSWFDSFKIPWKNYGLFHLSRLCTVMSKLKWDMTRIQMHVDPNTGIISVAPTDPSIEITIQETDDDDDLDDDGTEDYVAPAVPEDTTPLINGIVIFEAASSISVHTKTIHHVNEYLNVVRDTKFPQYHYTPTIAPADVAHRIRIDYADIAATPVGIAFGASIRTIVTKGQDLLVTKFLDEKRLKQKKPPGVGRIVFWPCGGGALDYVHHYIDDDYEFVMSRCNSVLIGNRHLCPPKGST